MRPSPTYLAMRAYTRARLTRARLRGPRDWRGVRILGYHRLAETPEPLSVRPRRFRAQMEAVRASGAEPIRLDRALDLLAAGPVEGRYVCVTFDDGYHDNLEYGEPVLRELGLPATIFVPSAIIDGEADYSWYDESPRALTWDEIRELVAGGLVDVQAHTRTHPWLPRVGDEEARREILGCKPEIEREVGYTLTSFCYPAGLWGEREAAIVRGSDYRAGVTTDPGLNTGAGPMETLKRTMVYWEDSDADFAAKLAGALDRPPALRAWLYRRRARPESPI